MFIFKGRGAWHIWTNLLSWVIINLQGSPIFFLLTIPKLDSQFNHLLFPFVVQSKGWVRLFVTPSVSCSPLGSSVHGISQARILEWVTISYSRDNGILFNHKKEWNNAIFNNMDGPRDYHTKGSKSEREDKYHRISLTCGI